MERAELDRLTQEDLQLLPRAGLQALAKRHGLKVMAYPLCKRDNQPNDTPDAPPVPCRPT